MTMKLKNYLVGRILFVTLVCVLLFAAVAVGQAIRNIRVEGVGARQVQLLTAGLYELQTLDSTQLPGAVSRIRELARSPDLRHIQFELRDAQGAVVAQSTPQYSGEFTGRVGEWLGRLNDRVPRREDGVSWTLARPDGDMWQVSLLPNLVSEQEEAAQDLIGLLVMLVALAAALAAGTALALRHAVRPMSSMLSTLDQLGRRNYTVRLPPSPIHEIEAVGNAINQLAHSLAELEASRKSLSVKVLSLQEDERAHFARELHDELGQKLTIIRMNAGYLAKTSQLDRECRYALSDISEATASIQQEVRELLGRLRPIGPGHKLDAREFGRLVRLLVNGWRERPGHNQQFTLELRLEDQPIDDGILLAVYRMTQEALTNIAKHARAQRVDISIVRQQDAMVWRIRDDGCGIPSMPSAYSGGSGLVGMRERVWSLGGSFDVEASDEGTLLRAHIPLPAFQPKAAPQDHFVDAMTIIPALG